MRFRATGRDRQTGEYVEIVFEAASPQAALTSAQQRGINVDALNPAGLIPPSATPPPLPPLYPGQWLQQPQPTRYIETERPAQRQDIRVWPVLLVVAALIGCIVNPVIGYGFAVLLSSLILFYFIPGINALSSGLLGLMAGRPVKTMMQLSFIALIAFLSAILAVAPANVQRAWKEQQIADAKAADENARRTAEADAKVNLLVADGHAKLQAGDVAQAAAKLREANSISDAQALGECRRMLNLTEQATNNKIIHDRLIALKDVNFANLSLDGKLPAELHCEYEALNQSTIALARPMIPTVQVERVLLAKKQAADAEQRRKSDLARLEADRQQLEAVQKHQKDIEDQATAVQAAADKAVQSKVDQFVAALENDEMASKLVSSTSIRQEGGLWKATVTVKNLWHVRNYQIGYQDAQNIWSLWAAIASPSDPDKVFLKLVDLNGNEVGGSRMWGGSLIWVKE